MERNLLLASFISFLMILFYYIYLFKTAEFHNYNMPSASFDAGENSTLEKEEGKAEINAFDSKLKEESNADEKQAIYHKDFFKENPEFRVIATEKYQLNAVNKTERYRHFDVENNQFFIKASTENASIVSWKLKKYKNVNGEHIDSIFDLSSQTPDYLPLGTYFRSKTDADAPNKSKHAHNFPQNHLYDYRVFIWENGKLDVLDFGTFEGYQTDPKAIKYLKEGVKFLKKQYNKDFEKKNIMRIVLFQADFYVHNFEKKIRLYKYIFIRENQNLLDFFLIFKNISDQEIYIESNDSEVKSASFYTYWGNSLGPYLPGEERSIYEKVSLSYLDNFNANNYGELFLLDNNKKNIENFKWLAMDSRYLAFFLIPRWKINHQGNKIWDNQFYFANAYIGNFQEKSFLFGLWNYQDRLDHHQEYLELGFPSFYLKQGETKTIAYSSFVGPKTWFVLNQDFYADFNLGTVKDQSWIPLIKPLEWFIEFLIFLSYNIIHNYGISIVLLAIFLKVIFYPLTKRTTISMKKMQALTPKIQEIERTFRNNAQKKQEALFRLYSKEKVNPFSGCLPIIIQIPVFYALWSVLPSLLELKNVDFLWINDLSSPDTVMKLNFFSLGLINLNLNILPLLMTLTSIIQMKLTPKNASLNISGGDQKVNMFNFMQYGMPILFLFLFWSMPSGLVLYWTVQNCLQIINQIYVNIKG